MKANTTKIGVRGEKIAREYLQTSNYKIIKTNYTCKLGEIDIIAYKDNTYVFVEVKTRRTLSYGRPVEAINYNKKIHLMKAAQNFIQAFQIKNCNYRFDAVEIFILPYQPIKINHIENII